MSGEEDAVLRRDEVAALRHKSLLKKEFESWLRAVKEDLNAAKKECKRTEELLNSFRSAAQVLGEVINPLENEHFLVVVNNKKRYVVGCGSKVDKRKLTSGTRVTLDKKSMTIRRVLPPELDPFARSINRRRSGKIDYSAVGGLSNQLRELRESIELPLMNPELFLRVGVKAPKAVLLYGPPGTGKTLLARQIAFNVDANFLKVDTNVMCSRFLGGGASTIVEIFTCARDNQPCIIFIDEIDAIGGRRLSDGTGMEREIHRTMMALLNQLDGFDELVKIKMIMTTNRPDILDPALLRPGRIDKKIEIPLPNEHSRMEILKIHAVRMAKRGEIDYEDVVKLSKGFNGADLQNVCTEAGMFAVRADRDYVLQKDFIKAVGKLKEAKKLESSAHYRADFGKD